MGELLHRSLDTADATAADCVCPLTMLFEQGHRIMTLNFTLPSTHVLVSFSFTCLVSARVIVVYANESNETNMAKKCTDEAERKFGRNVKELSEEPQ